MKSYFTFTQDRDTGEIEIRALLLKEEATELEYIRHFLVKLLTNVLEPEVKKVTFRWD